MDAKDRKIARLEKQLAKQKMQESFVAQNLDSFDSLIDKLQSIKNDTGEKRYFGLRKGRPGSVKEGKDQVMFRLNLLVTDLIEYRARYNLSPENLAEADLKTLAVRLSQDTGTLITHLDKGRIKRTRKRYEDKRAPAVTNFKVEEEEHLVPVTTKSGQVIMDQKRSGEAPPQSNNYKMDEVTDKLADQPIAPGQAKKQVTDPKSIVHLLPLLRQKQASSLR
jgi:hypothetical protein